MVHEIISPDIHVDIAVIEPTNKRNYYTLVTMGMGAHRMNVPQELVGRFERAEMVICLPPDWQVQEENEQWYWPMRWLKIMARLPIENNTWLGFGHTVPSGVPFADNTKLSGMVLFTPSVEFGDDSDTCAMPDRSIVNFYQMIPLHEEEMDYKVGNSLDALLERMPDSASVVVDINRPSVV